MILKYAIALCLSVISHIAMAAPTQVSASQISTSGGVTLQSQLNAMPTNATLSANTGAALIGSASGLGVQADINSKLPLSGGTLTGNLSAPSATINTLTTPIISSVGGTGAMVDLRANNNTGTYLGSTNVFSFYPTVGWVTGDYQRAQNIINFVSSKDATQSETGLTINATMATGQPPNWVANTAYALGDLVDINDIVYKATKAGTSGTVAPSGTGSAINDGSVIWAYQCYDQCNAKMPLFISAVANAGAGHVWGQDTDLVLNAGFNGNFAAVAEFDGTNNSGVDQPNSNILFVTGLAGSHPMQYGISLFNASPNDYLVYDAIAFGGSKLAKTSDLHSFSGSPYLMLDNGSHNYGLYLNGTYANKTAFIGGTASNTDGTGQDQGQVMISPTGGANSLQLGYVFQSGVKEYARIQASNAIGATSLYLQPAGGAVYIGSGNLQLKPLTYSALPACNSASAGSIAYITDASAAITVWHQQVTAGGGANKAFVACNGSGWYAFDY